MSVTAPNRDRIANFAGTDLPASRNGEGGFAALGFGIRQGHTDLRRLAAAMEALTRAVPGKPEADARTRAMHETIAQGRFRLAYQPVIALADRSLRHFEALLRPIPPEAGATCTTQDFVTFAEAAGLSQELDLAVLGQALAALRAAPGARVAVNFSGLSIQSREFQERALVLIGGQMAEHAAPSRRLLIELTETAEITDFGTAAATLDRLRAAGVPVCLDDVGAGASAFRYLRDFRFDFVKIDGAYVRAATSGGQARRFVASICDLARSVGAQVIAEMIETEAEAAVMTGLGVEFGQGWLFGRPGALPGPNA